MPKKIIALLVVLVLAIVGIVLAMNKEAPEAIKIGANFALTGNLAKYGEWTKNGVELAVEGFNKNNNRQIEVIYEDNAAKPADAVTAYRKLKDIDGVKYTLTFLSQIALAIQPLANQDKIVQMDLSATTPDYSKEGDYSFRTGIVATQLSSETAKIMSSKFNVQETGILYVNNDFGKGMVRVFKDNFKGKILAEEGFEPSANDVRTQILKLKQAGVRNLLLVNQGTLGGTVVRQAKELGLGAQIYSDIYSIEGAEFLETAKGGGEGIIYVAPKFDANDSDPSVSGFVKAYKERYGQEPNIFSAQAFDGGQALIMAIMDCPANSADCVKKELTRLDFDGASGTIKFDKYGDVQKEIELKTVRKNQFVKYE